MDSEGRGIEPSSSSQAPPAETVSTATPPTPISLPQEPGESPSGYSTEEWEPSEPKDFKTLFESESDICFWSGDDSKFKLREMIHYEFKCLPLEHPGRDVEAYDGESLGHRVLIIYIDQFFQDNKDFAMYVKGEKNISALVKSTFTGRAFYGTSIATPINIFVDDEILGSMTKYDVIPRNETKGIRWRFYYETACAAFRRLELDIETYLGGNPAPAVPLCKGTQQEKEMTGVQVEEAVGQMAGPTGGQSYTASDTSTPEPETKC